MVSFRTKDDVRKLKIWTLNALWRLKMISELRRPLLKILKAWNFAWRTSTNLHNFIASNDFHSLPLYIGSFLAFYNRSKNVFKKKTVLQIIHIKIQRIHNAMCDRFNLLLIFLYNFTSLHSLISRVTFHVLGSVNKRTR